VHFLIGQNLSDAKTARTENSNRFEHRPIGFMSDFAHAANIEAIPVRSNLGVGRIH
jgi:hypothetical protein